MSILNAASVKNALGAALGPGGSKMAEDLVTLWLGSGVTNYNFSTGLGAPAGSNVTAQEWVSGNSHTTILTFTSRSITMTDEAGVVAYGGTKVYDFPAGLILIRTAVANLTITKSGSGINADFDGDFGVGTTTAGNNNALATTEQNIIPTTATPQAVAGVTTAKGFNAAAIAPLDGTSTAIDVYINGLIDDADQDGGGAWLISGALTLIWDLGGDV
jgi:hypothetical protein